MHNVVVCSCVRGDANWNSNDFSYRTFNNDVVVVNLLTDSSAGFPMHSRISGKKITLFYILMQVTGFTCFQCPGYTIPRKFICDGINNCGDNSDEEGCPNTGKICIILSKMTFLDLILRKLLPPFKVTMRFIL